MFFFQELILSCPSLQIQHEWHREDELRGAEGHDGEAGGAADSPRPQGDDQGAWQDDKMILLLFINFTN